MSDTAHRLVDSKCDPQNHAQDRQPGLPPSDHQDRDNVDHHKHEGSQSSASTPLAASSPLTDSDNDNKSNKLLQEEDTKAGIESKQGSHGPISLTTSGSTQELGNILHALDLIRRGKHPALGTHCERLEFPLPVPQYFLFRQLLSDTYPQNNSGERACRYGKDRNTVTTKLSLQFDLDLEITARWALDKLRYDYDARRAIFSIRMLTALHQIVAHQLGDLLSARFRAALQTSGRGGEVRFIPGAGQVFKEPEPEPEPEHRPAAESSPSRQPQRVPERPLTRAQAQQDKAATSRADTDGSAASTSHSPETEADESSTDGSFARVGNEDARCPDIGLTYVPPQGAENYFPGVIIEIGYSHPLPDFVAKRLIRYSDGNVRYVMAFNIPYNKNRQDRKMSITAHQLVCTEDTWYPEKCLDSYDVREASEALADQEADQEADIGLRLSHLHETLLPAQGQNDIPITLPLQKVIQIVEDGFAIQNTQDKYQKGKARPPPPNVVRGKRVRTETPPELDDEAALLRDPNASYTAPSCKRRRTGKTA